MILIRWTLSLAVGAAKASPFGYAQIAKKVDDFHLLDKPARCERNQGSSFQAGLDCRIIQ